MKFTTKPVLIIGDLILDEYVYGTVDRISPEAPVPIVKLERHEYRLGGAANVAANIRTLGGNPIPIGVLGVDSASVVTRGLLYGLGIDDKFVTDIYDRKTTLKQRIIANGQQIARLDEETVDVDPTSYALEERIERLLPVAGAVIISDYAKGVITPFVLAQVQRLGRKYNTPVFIDPKIRHADLYRGGILTPNVIEAMGMAKCAPPYSDEEIDRAGRRILLNFDCPHVLITRGGDGMTLFTRGNTGQAVDISSVNIPTRAKAVFDVAGAGDTVIAALALAYASGYSMPHAAEIANVAAGIVVGKRGTATTTIEEIQAEIDLHTIPLDRSDIRGT